MGPSSSDPISRFLDQTIKCDNGKNLGIALLVVGFTGWIPNKELELGLKAWPGEPFIETYLILVGRSARNPFGILVHYVVLNPATAFD